MRFLRTLLFLPILVFISPALVLLTGAILLLETRHGALSSIFLAEVQKHGLSDGFRAFMERTFVPTYRHNIQSFVLGAAGFLVVTVGLRGLGVLPLEYVYVALGTEFTLLVMWAITVYFTVDDHTAAATPKQTVHEVLQDERVDKLVNTMKELGAHLALLENRLKMTETRFEQFGKLDTSLQGLSSKLNLIVSDQFNVRVKREFDQLLAEITSRASGNNGSGMK